MGLSSQLELVEVYQLLKAVVLSVQAVVSSQEETVFASQEPGGQWLHLFSPVCVFMCVRKLPVWDDA